MFTVPWPDGYGPGLVPDEVEGRLHPASAKERITTMAAEVARGPIQRSAVVTVLSIAELVHDRRGQSLACGKPAEASVGPVKMDPMSAVSWWWMTWIAMAPFGVKLAVVDARTKLLPLAIMKFAYAAVVSAVLLVAALDQSWQPLTHALIGWALVGGLYLLVWVIAPKGMGYGDVRLAGVLGLTLGLQGLPAVVLGAWLGLGLGIVGAGVVWVRTRSRVYPHGPYMIAGAALGAVVAAGLGLS